MVKRIAILVYVLALSGLTAHAQGTFYGTTRHGGTKGGGTIFRMDTDGTNFSVEHNIVLDANPGRGLNETPLLNVGGLLYGVTMNGGIIDYGTLFEYNPATGVFTKKFEWSKGEHGSNPQSGLITFGGNNDVLYGTTYYSIFSYTRSTNVFKKLVDLDYSNFGYAASNGLVEFNGVFYGATAYGGATNKGVIYKFEPALAKITKLADLPFQGVFHNLVLGSNNKLYFSTQNGGNNDKGAILEFDPALPTIVNLKYSFPAVIATVGSNPINNLILVGTKMYGTCQQGGTNGWGTLFEFDPVANTVTKKVDFGSTVATTGSGNVQFLTKGVTATTIFGIGQYGNGTVFEYNTLTSVYTKRTDLVADTHGYGSYSGLTLVNDKMYATTGAGALGNAGSIIEYVPATAVITKKIDFEVAPLGIHPENTLIYEGGKVYGMTVNGGAKGLGVIFEFDPIAKTYTKKFDFDDATLKGVNPMASMVKATDGKYYGTTSSGGTNGSGIIFSYDVATNTFVKKYDLQYTLDGSRSSTTLALLNSKLYGLTQYGGANGNRTLFEYDYVANVFTKQFDFPVYNSILGTSALSPLFAASDGKLYGTTANGGNTDTNGNQYGVLFQFDPATDTYLKKVDFGYTDKGAGANGNGLIEPVPGRLFGLLNYGGQEGQGTLYEYVIATNTFTKKLDLTYQKGNNPNGSLIVGDAGKLFFTCNSGGGTDPSVGTVAMYGLNTTEYTKVAEFIGTNGAHPGLGTMVKTPLVFDVTPPVVTPGTTATNSSLATAFDVSVTVIDTKSPVTAVKLIYKSPTSSAAATTVDMNKVGTTNEYRFTIPGTAVSEVGIQYKVVATSGGGTTDETTTKYTVAPASSSNSTVSYTAAGIAETNYRIISIPYVLNNRSVASVFDELGVIDKKKWRMSHYQSGSNSELLASSNLEPGLGYWLLMKTLTTVNTGPGTSVSSSTDTPFEITVTAGLNQIGNPYPFKLNWADVIGANAAGVPDKIRVYSAGWADALSLNAGEGGFININVSTLTKLKFPSIKTAARMNGDKNLFKNPLTENNWQLYIEAKQGDQSNGISGIGMNENASDGLDRFDGANMPRFFERFLEINHSKKISSQFDAGLNKENTIFMSMDIVPSAREHVWEFDIKSDEAEQFTTLQWDNTFFGDNGLTLVLWDEARQVGIDMRTQNEYVVDRFVSGAFRVYYGEKNKLADRIRVTELVLHSVSPNPAESDVKIAFSVPEDRFVSFEAIDLTGRKIWTSTGDYTKGYHEVVWSNEYRQGAKGIYIIQVKSGAEAGKARINLK